MEYKDKIVDKQVGRNSDLLAQSIAALPTKEERYPYLRILVSVIEQAHPEWNQAPTKDRQVGNLVFRMSRGELNVDEVAEIVRIRDAERGYGPAPDRPQRPKRENAGSDPDASAQSQADTPSKDQAEDAVEAPAAEASATDAPVKEAAEGGATALETSTAAPAADSAAGKAPAAEGSAAVTEIPPVEDNPSAAKPKAKAKPKPRASRAKKPAAAKEAPPSQADIFAEAAAPGAPQQEGGSESAEAKPKAKAKRKAKPEA
ncbi:MAG: hypothetical protein ACI80V_002980 [Rhodothermales bacterium]|jgi:hypothetical protein